MSLTDAGDGTASLSLSPGYDDAGMHSLTVTVSDGSASDSETISISVSNTNRAPSVTNPGTQTGNVGDPVSLADQRQRSRRRQHPDLQRHGPARRPDHR